MSHIPPEASRQRIEAARDAAMSAVEDVMGATMGEIVAALRRAFGRLGTRA